MYGDDDDEYGDVEYEYDEEDEYDEEAAPSRARLAVLALGVAMFVVLGWFVVRPALDGDDSAEEPLVADASTTFALSESEADGTEADDVATETSELVGRIDATTSPVDADPPEVTTTGAPLETDPSEVTTTDETPVETDPSEVTTTDETPVETDPPEATATAASATAGGATYDTLPDGTPAPVVAVFDVDSITLTGAVPSQSAKDRLLALAVANARPGQADTLVDNVTINPDVPVGVGVRVVELTSARFPELKTEVLPAHAAELDRVVAVMNALPNVTALVIGHADQRGDPLKNLALSEQRADAVVNYMASQGIAPERLSSRAVGASDLLALRNDEAAFALNRRTEFVLYGLLVE